MLDSFLTPGVSYFIFLIIFLLLFILQICYYIFIFLRLVRYHETNAGSESAGVSVVICARNEYIQLKENLPFILSQEYPDFEVVVVNHASEDETSFLLSQMAEEYPRLKIVEIRENLNFFDGKKFPLSIGIKSASHDLVLLTDADCHPVSPEWISRMVKGFSVQKDIVLGYGGFRSSGDVLNRLIRYDAVHIALQYLSCALAGLPYMGVGRNMAYRKSLFYQNKGFISHYTLHSGDDDLFINQVATRKNTSVVIDPESFTISQPKKTFTQWWIQKKRHISTGRYYRTKHKILLGTYTGSIILFYGFLAVLLISGYNIWLVLTLFLLRLAGQLFIFRKVLTRFNEKGIWFLVPVFEFMMIFVNIALSFSMITSRETKWK